MSTLAIHLLGSPRFVVDNTPCDLRLRKGIALLALLAANDSPCIRDSLAACLWPETDGGRILTGHESGNVCADTRTTPLRTLARIEPK